MKYTSLQTLGSLLGAACLVVACASSDDTDPTIPAEDSGTAVHDTGTAHPEDTGTIVYDTGTIEVPDTSTTTQDTGTGGSTSCSAHCTQNSDCTSACTPPSGDSACCDSATGECYIASGACQSTTTPGEDASVPY